MEDRVDHLFQEWHRLGGEVLLKEIDSISVRSPEEVIAESSAHCRESGRLTWVVLDWLIGHIGEIDEEILLQETKEKGDQSVLGVLCDAASMRKPHLKLDRIIASCLPNDRIEPFFYRVAGSSLASRLTKENPLEVFHKWNFLCSELRYL